MSTNTYVQDSLIALTENFPSFVDPVSSLKCLLPWPWFMIPWPSLFGKILYLEVFLSDNISFYTLPLYFPLSDMWALLTAWSKPILLAHLMAVGCLLTVTIRTAASWKHRCFYLLNFCQRFQTSAQVSITLVSESMRDREKITEHFEHLISVRHCGKHCKHIQFNWHNSPIKCKY